jgi:hypothetical protein
MVPQYAFVNGFRPDFDFRLGKAKNQWLIVSPQIYLSSERNGLFKYNNMWGTGLEIQHRHYLKAGNNQPEGAYLGYGPVFQHFSIDEERLYSEKVIENGIEYTFIKYGPVTTNINKFGFTLTSGYQALISNVVYFDFYIGAGIRLSFDDSGTSGFSRIYNGWYGGYGYSGTMITAGVRVGMIY